jgi:hypothetical protein
MSLGYALRQRSVLRSLPFPHWEIDRPLTADARQEVIVAFAPDTPWDDSTPSPLLTSSESIASLPVVRDNVSQFPAIGSTIDDLLSRKTIERIESMLSRSMDGGFLSMEIVRDGRAVEVLSPTNTSAPQMTLLIPVLSEVASPHPVQQDAPRRDNVGWMFVPSDYSPRELIAQPLAADSPLLVINYVIQATDWKLPPRKTMRVA